MGFCYCLIIIFFGGIVSCTKADMNQPVVGAEQAKQVEKILAGKTIGLIVNPTSRVGDKHLIEALRQRGYEIGRLFALEHGLRGVEDAGAKIGDGSDEKTGLAIVSLYGGKTKPSAQDLAGLDILVFDIQDVGVRFYTYLSSLGYIMQACAEHNVPLVVLDRPNPNIAFVDGPVLQPKFRSFVGRFEVPLLHGMTLGELALMINGEGWLEGGRKCDLTVIPIQNYTRHTHYSLPVKPSPNLPNDQAVRLYPSLALFEATNISVGRGTDFPFQVLGGLRAEYGDFSFTPTSRSGATNPKHKGRKLYGQDLRQSTIKGLDISLFMDWRHKAQALDADFLTRPNWLDKLMGTDAFRKQIEQGVSAKRIRRSWQADLRAFKRARKPYLLYKD